MAIIPILTPKQLLNALLKLGFLVVRTCGSHFHLEHQFTKRVTTIALHHKAFSRYKTKTILDQAGVTVQELSLIHI